MNKVIGKYLDAMSSEYGQIKLYPESAVRDHFHLSGTCCDGAAELSNQGRLNVKKPGGAMQSKKNHFDLFEVKSSCIDRKHTRNTPNNTTPDIGQAQIEATAKDLSAQIVMRQGICFIGSDINLRGAEICGHDLYRKVHLKRSREPEKIRNLCPLKVYKYDPSYEILW